MALQQAMVSSKSNEWATPSGLFDELDKEFHFTLDPCATSANAKCNRYFTADDDGLKQSWANEVVFMNPPYGGHTDKWLRKAWQSSLEGAVVVCLIVSSTDRSYWHDYIFPHAAEVRWLRGRITFGEAKSTAPFASAIVIFQKHNELQKQVFYNRKESCCQQVIL